MRTKCTPEQRIQELETELAYTKQYLRGLERMFRQVSWRDLRAEVLALDFHECTACDAPATAVVYLIKPSVGGTPHISNLTASCEGCMRLCARQKHFATPDERRAFIQEHIRA